MKKKILVLGLIVLSVSFVAMPSVTGAEEGEEENEEESEGNVGLHHWLAIGSLIFLIGAVVTGIMLYLDKFSKWYSEIMYIHIILGVLTLLIFLLTSWVMI